MKTAKEVLDEISPNRPWALGGKTDQMIISAMKEYAAQAVKEAGDRIYEDVSNRIYIDVLTVKDELS